MTVDDSDNAPPHPCLVHFDIAGTVLEKHSVTISGHRTSISIEKNFWHLLKDLAIEEKISLAVLIRSLDEARTGSLSSALRCYVLQSIEKKLRQDQ